MCMLHGRPDRLVLSGAESCDAEVDWQFSILLGPIQIFWEFLSPDLYY